MKKQWKARLLAPDGSTVTESSHETIESAVAWALVAHEQGFDLAEIDEITIKTHEIRSYQALKTLGS